MERKMKNIVAIFALVLLIVSLLFIPFGTIKANAEESCPHENSIWTGYQNSTCQRQGYNIYYCYDCGEVYHVMLDTIDHEYGKRKYYSEDGKLEYTEWVCIFCDEVFYVEYPENTLPGWAIALIVIAAVLAVGGVATGIVFYWKKTKQND